MSSRVHLAIVVLLATVAAAGIVISTTDDLGPLTFFDVPVAWQIPALVVVGLLTGLSLGDLKQTAIAIATVIILSTVVYGLTIALPGLQVDRSAVRLMNRGLIQGLFALILIGLFILVGAVISVLVNSYARDIDT